MMYDSSIVQQRKVKNEYVVLFFLFFLKSEQSFWEIITQLMTVVFRINVLFCDHFGGGDVFYSESHSAKNK